MLNGHGGNIYALAKKLGCSPKKIIDMSSNLNPLGPPAGLIDFLATQIQVITCLPEVDSSKIISLFAKKHKIDPANVLATGGTTQLIYALPGILKAKNILILGPTYADYEDACIISKTSYSYFMSQAKDDFEPDINKLEKLLPNFDTLFICNPNNPTGKLILAKRLKKLCIDFPKTRFIIDESYLPFINQYERQSMIGAGLPNLLVLNSMSKIFKIPGLRIGFLIAPAKIISEFRRHLLPWSVNSLAQTALGYLLEQGAFIDDYIIKTQEFIKKEKIIFLKHLENYPELKPCLGLTPFILIKVEPTLMAEKICRILSQKKILIRNCANFKGLSNQFIRIALKNQEENILLAQALEFLGKGG